MKNKSFALIEKYAKVLAEMEGYDKETWKIFVNVDGRIYETENGADFADLKRGDVVIASGATGSLFPVEHHLLRTRKDIQAVVLSTTPYCKRFEQYGADIVAAIDDMAQIVGYKAPCVGYGDKAISRALKSSAACLVKDHYTITTGRNLYEAVAALTVLERSAEVNTKAEVLGGVKTLPKLEADLMRQVYKKKNSQTEFDAPEYEETLKPASEEELLEVLSQKRPDLGAVVHTYSKYCCMFAAARKPLPVEDPDLQKIFGAEVPLAGYGLSGSRRLMKNTVEAFGDGMGVIMTARGIICGGVDMEDALENCRKLEDYAAEYIESRWAELE